MNKLNRFDTTKSHVRCFSFSWEISKNCPFYSRVVCLVDKYNSTKNICKIYAVFSASKVKTYLDAKFTSTRILYQTCTYIRVFTFRKLKSCLHAFFIFYITNISAPLFINSLICVLRKEQCNSPWHRRRSLCKYRYVQEPNGCHQAGRQENSPYRVWPAWSENGSLLLFMFILNNHCNRNIYGVCDVIFICEFSDGEQQV